MKSENSGTENTENGDKRGVRSSGTSPEVFSEISRRRTFAIISHPDAGKTTLTEKLLFHGGVIHQTGEVKGKAGTRAVTSDWMELERTKGISITSSVMSFDYGGLKINLLDTPGHKDFSEDTYRVLMAVDSACMLIDLAKGVEERTRKLYEVCRYRNIPIFTFVNKMDREGKRPIELIDEVESTLGMSCYPMTWPLGVGSRFLGVYDRMRGKMLYRSEEGSEEGSEGGLDGGFRRGLEDSEEYTQFREEMELIEGVLPSFDEERFRRGELSLLTFGSAKQNFGVDLFLDFFCQYALGPQSRRTREGAWVDPQKHPHFSAFVFKMQANMDRRHRDRVAFLRVCSGRFERGMRVRHSRLDKEIRISYSNQFLAQDRETLDVAYAGDIIGVSDAGNFVIGDSITDNLQSGGIQFEDIPKFAPELFARMKVGDALKRKKMQEALEHLSDEGAIQLFVDPVIGAQDYLIGVVGELQFEVLLHRMLDEYGLEVRLEPQPLRVARWPRDSISGHPVDNLKGGFTIYRDLSDQPVILLAQEWDLNWAQRENPDVVFASSVARVR